MIEDRYRLDRFIRAQEWTYEEALIELRAGKKRSHWMWFIFPQMEGLGRSATAQHYAIKSLDEARAYLAHPLLGTRLRECVDVLLGIKGHTAEDIFGYPDVLKLHSSLTLFDQVSDGDDIFVRALNKYYDGERDGATLQLIQRNAIPHRDMRPPL